MVFTTIEGLMREFTRHTFPMEEFHEITDEELITLHKTIEFIREYWTELSILFIVENSSCHSSYLDGVPTHRSGWWSCFMASPMISSFFGAIFDCKSHGRFHLGDPELFRHVSKAGYVYYVSIEDHDFTLININEDCVIYCDFYAESERGQYEDKEKGPDAFRIEVMTTNEIYAFISAYARRDYEAETKFHKASQFYLDSYNSPLYNPPDKRDFSFKVLPITQIPTPHLCLTACWDSLARVTKIKNFDEAVEKALETNDVLSTDIVECYKNANKDIILKLCDVDTTIGIKSSNQLS